jgi:hypothetical protein
MFLFCKEEGKLWITTIIYVKDNKIINGGYFQILYSILYWLDTKAVLYI